ncbi:MAG: RsiV family protein [Zoogloeaceae bacterium]|nr:RsiV family protein [Zoogloeaceae bacterium]
MRNWNVRRARTGLLLTLGCFFSALAASAEENYERYEERVYQAKSCLRDARGEERCSEARLVVPYFPDAAWLNDFLAKEVIGRLGGQEAAGEAKGGAAAPEAGDYQALMNGKLLLSNQDGEAAKDGEETIYGDEFQGRLTFEGRYGSLLQYSFLSCGYGGGAAHGVCGIRNVALHIDARAIVPLAEILEGGLGGNAAQLAERQESAYRAQLVKEKLFSPEDSAGLDRFMEEWFHPNENWKIVQGGLAFSYSNYEAGPYSYGMPDVVVPKGALTGIVKPEILRLIP